MTENETHGLTGKLVTLRGDRDVDGMHNMYLVLMDSDPTSPLVTVMHTKHGNTATVRRGRCIPVIGVESVLNSVAHRTFNPSANIPTREQLSRIGKAMAALEMRTNAPD